jgi:glycosyltransferase involved in cell wall biosynthesis
MVDIKISAFFPAYNEEANVEPLALALDKILSEVCSDYEVIIVNDGSRDSTREIADRLASEHSHIRAVHHDVNRGYGGAIKTGFHESRLDWVFFTDGDRQFDVSEIKLLTPHADRYDMIVGYRLNRQDSSIRRLNAFAWGTLVRLLFDLQGVRDIDCAFKLFKRDLLIRDTFEAEGAMISTELLAKAVKIGYRIHEVGVHHLPRTAGKQTGGDLRVIFRAFRELFRLYKRLS